MEIKRNRSAHNCNSIFDMNAAELPWLEREKLLTERDKQAIQRAIYSHYSDIDEGWAETEYGRAELHSIIMRKYRQEEFLAGIL